MVSSGSLSMSNRHPQPSRGLAGVKVAIGSVGEETMLNIGRDQSTAADVSIPAEVLRRHVAVLGATGSGKTVLCKVLVEEAVRNNIPVLAVDPQGDVASLVLPEDPEELARRGTPLQVQQEFLEKARVAIFTPASSKGIPLSVNPLRFPELDIPREEAVLALDMTAASLAGILGYDLGTPTGKAARASLFSVLDGALKRKAPPRDLSDLARILSDPPPDIAGELAELISRKEAEELARKVRYLTVGASSLLFEMGTQLDLEMLLRHPDGKVPVNVVYLNSLSSEADRQFFLTSLLREVYLWMLKHPSNEVQLLLYVDEVAPYIPPYPRNPPPKQAYALLFKQARKYGVSLLAATQNVTDVDYKALGQANTWCLGRLVMQQDVTRVAKFVQSVDPTHAEQILGSLPGLTTSEFFLISPDAHDRIVRFKTRWLATHHRTMEESELADAMAPGIRASFETPPTAAPVTVPPPEPGPVEPASTPTDLQTAIAAAVGAERGAVSATAVSARTHLAVDVVTRELKGMVKARVLATGRDPVSKEALYWPVEDAFQPSVGLTRELLNIPMRLAQVDAIRAASSLIERDLLVKKETVTSAELDHIPIWKVACQWTTKALFSAPKGHTDDYFVNARTGAFVTIRGTEMHFEKLAREMAGKVQDLNDEVGVVFTAALPREVGILPPIKVSLYQAYEILRRTFGVTPMDGRLALLPIWRLTLRRKDGSGTRTITIDAVVGKTMSGEF